MAHLSRYLLPALLFISTIPAPTHADKLCIKGTVSNGKVKFSKSIKTTGRCPKNTFELTDTSTFTGAAGAAGTNGADGSLRIYGDGSTGDVTLTTGSTAPDPNAQFGNLTISAGYSLSINSGTIIRSNGTVTINGTINVGFGSHGGLAERGGGGATLTMQASSQTLGGYGGKASQLPEYGPNTLDILGGLGGSLLSEASARTLLHLTKTSCGGGSGSNTFQGGSSGGSLTILAKNGIIISSTGAINSNGSSVSFCAGGGSGGVIILASPVSISNSGTISAIGGNGGSSRTYCGAGGGGGGGLIHLLAPSITTGSLVVTGGTHGLTGTTVTANPRQGGGGGGGGCAGGGGDGANVSSTNNQDGYTDGGTGHALTTSADPTALF